MLRLSFGWENSFNQDLQKLLSIRIFKKFTVSEIISKTWKLLSKVQIEKLEEDIFKFSFGCREDRDYIFKSRPWSLNGSHLILKEWPADKALSRLNFQYTTLTIQVHVLPPVFIHEGTARMVENKVGRVHNETINRRCVVANHYLRFRVEIAMDNPLPAGYF